MEAVVGRRGLLFSEVLGRLTSSVSREDDTAELRLQKATMVMASLLFIPAGFLWGLAYLAFGDLRSASIPLGYTAISVASLVSFRLNRRYEHFRFSQLLLILLLPALLMASLGGYVPSSAVIIWSFVCPMGALIFAGRREAIRWLVLFLGMLVLSGLLDRGLGAPVRLPEGLVIGLFVLNIGVVSTFVFTLLAYFVAEKDRIHGLLQIEQEKSERLLLNVLPKEIAPALKEGKDTARRFDSASILFADVVGFTSLSAHMAPEDTVALLNEIFSHFDALVEAYGLEKIRTIGDNYMVASGVPTPRADHAQALAAMALDMCNFLSGSPWRRDVGLDFRLGMSSGPLVGAVIGRTKFHYDVWGDAVNRASRMESHGVPGKIQITADAYALLKDDFECERRGVIEVKGVGLMETWFLVGRRGMPGGSATA